MTERTLSILLRTSTLIAIIGFILMHIVFPDAVLPRYIVYAYAGVFGAVPILFIMTLVSRIFLLGLKEQPLSSIEQMYMIFYVFLTKEAREEWRNHIKERKNKGIS